MDIPYCCGIEMKLTSRPDHPLFADDIYDLRIPKWVCAVCGNASHPEPEEAKEPKQEDQERMDRA